jgi:hypothetical protein
VIKKACRTRGSLPVIRRDAFAKPDNTPCTASLAFDDNGTNYSVAWQDENPCDNRLSKVFVFDSSTADNYLEQDGPATFTPHGLDVLPRLTKVCDAINERLKHDIEDIKREIISNASGWKYVPTTAVGQLISRLNANTKGAELDLICGLDDTKVKRLSILVEALKADPKRKARETRASKARLDVFAQNVASTASNLSDENVVALKGLVENAKATAQAAKIFASSQGDASELPGTRDALWRKLWEAARVFSSSAYPQKDFPVTEDAARCLLCQQPLEPEAVKRARAFEAFCQDQSQQLAAAAARKLMLATETFMPMKPLSDECIKCEADFGTTTSGDFAAVVDFVKKADKRLAALQDNLSKGIWTEPIAISASPANVLMSLAKALENRALTEESALDPLVRQSLVNEMNELADREWLGHARKDVLDQIQRYRRVALLEACQKETSTKGITTKNSELTKLLVTSEFCKCFKTETEALGLRTISVKLQEIKGAKGETKFGLRFESPCQFTISEIASEGEQRCIALAAFLAELSQSSHCSALVFDDPVSSLDHWNRARIAARVVKEAKVRQVIVFTHDAIFLNDLFTSAEQSAVPATYRFLDWRNSQPGWCNDGLPWECKTPEDRLDRLEKRQREIARTWGPRPSSDDASKMREAYSWLRSTIERIVERVIFADVVFRYRSYIKLKDLSRVVGFPQSECNEVARLFKRCCDVTDAHDQAQGKQASVPEPKELQDDINATKQLLVSIRARQKTATSSLPVPAS